MKIKNKRTMKRTSLLVIVLAVIAFIITGIFNLATQKNIEYVLESDSYSYLPKEAKNYIEEIYEESGEIILTEKNKEENKPYLNPEYVNYLSLSQEEKVSVSVIPNSFAIDYVFNKSYGSQETLPSSYDSRNVNGKNYVTEVKNQGNLDLCWTFATTEAAETYLLTTNKQTVTPNSQLFSERQIDYATSNNGIKDYQSEYTSYVDRKLGGGGNFFVATTALANGISLTDASWKNYEDTDLTQMELHEVLNYDNSLYELNNSINMPRLNLLDLDMTKEENIKLREEYINTIKTNIMKYGSAFVGTGSPLTSGGNGYYDSTLKNYVIFVDTTSTVKNHAMQIIGWDDNISYSYCADSECNHKSPSTCTNKVTRKGVWILRNSWGTDSTSKYPYPYLAYDSYNSDIAFITDLSAADKKDWDNNYVLGDNFSPVASTINTFDLDVNNNEKITKLKFISYSQNASYNIAITVDGKNTNEIYKVNNSQPGLVTLDLTDKNITFKENVSIKVIGQNESFLLEQLYLFTTNVDKTSLLEFDIEKSLTIDKSNLRLYATTKNIESGSKITYKLYNKANEDMSDKMTYGNNIVAENNVNTSIILDETLPKGDYKVDAIFEEKVLDSIYLMNEISGSGTEEDPYIITNSTQLYDIREDLDAYYILGNDIDLTEDTRYGGKYYNDGYGWVGAWGFSGTLDGNGHSIKGAYMANHNYSSGGYGLFRSLAGNVTIKNLVLEDFDITGAYWCGALAGVYADAQDLAAEYGNNNININNIVIRNSSIKGYKSTEYAHAQNHRIGGLIGGIDAPNSNVNISNIYMDATVDFAYGSVSTDSSWKYVEGGAALIRNVQANNFTMKNIQINGNVKRPEVLIDNIVANNNVQENIINTADTNVDISKLTKRETFSTWANFEDNWVMKTVDGIPRIPILKIAEDGFEYTSVSDISIELTTTKYPSIYDYILPDTSLAHRIDYEMEENYTVRMNGGTLKPLSPGKATIHIKSYYDGYEKDIPVTVTHSSTTPYYVVVFDPNGVDEEPTSTIFNKSTYGNTLTSNPYSKYNFEFLGWNTKADGTGTSYANREKINPEIENGGVIVLYAQWEAKKQTVTFDPNGGTGGIITKEFDYDSYYGDSLPIPTREGYGFGGWVYQKYNSEYKIEPKDRVSDIDPITVVAKWIENSYTIIHHPNGGKRRYKESDSYYECNYSLGTNGVDSKISFDSQYYRTGYTFKNWNTKPDGTGTSYENYTNGNYTYVNLTNVEDGVLNLYAIWEPNTYWITFFANGGIGEMEEQRFTSEDTFKINENTYTRKGYKFIGWNTSWDGTGTAYSDKQEISNCTQYLSLFAQWEIIEYRVILDKTNLVFNILEKQKLTATILPEDATNKNVIWETTNPNVAKVNEFGEVQPINDGTCEIICTSAEDSKVQARCTIIVDNTLQTTIRKTYNEDNTITVSVESKYEFEDTKPSWDLSGDKKTYTKTYNSNGTYSTAFKDIYHEAKTLTFTIDEIKSKYNVEKTYDTTTNQVTINVVNNYGMQATKPTWMLSGDAKIYTKIYSANGTYTTKFVDIEGIEKSVTFTIDEIDDKAPVIEIKQIYDENTNTVTVEAISNETLGATKPTWTLSADKKTYSKVYSLNGTYTTKFQDIYGNEISKTFVVNQIYSKYETVKTYDSTRNTVTVSVKNNLGLQATKPTWILNADKTMYSKVYNANGTYTTKFVDIQGEEKTITFIINEIDDKAPTLSTNIKYDAETNTVTVSVTSDEILGATKPTWTLSEDKMTYSKTYNLNGTYTTKFQDVYGNEVSTTFTVDRIQSKYEIVKTYDAVTNTTTVSVINNYGMQATKPTWQLSADKRVYTKIYSASGTYTTKFVDTDGVETSLTFTI